MKNKDVFKEHEFSKRIRKIFDNLRIDSPSDDQDLLPVLSTEISSKCISLPKSIAALCVTGLLKIIPKEFIGQCNSGDVILIYSHEEKSNIVTALKKPNDIYKVFANAVIMGNLDDDISPINSYVGLIRIGEKENNNIKIINAELLDSPITAPFDKNFTLGPSNKTHRHRIKYITLENKIVRLPLSKMAWDNFIKQKWMYLYIDKYDMKRLLPLISYADFLNWLLYTDDMAMLLTPIKENAAKVYFNSTVDEFPKGAMLQIDLKKMEEISLPQNMPIPNQHKIWILDWNCVTFKQNYIVVNPPADNSVQFNTTTIHTPSSIEPFNYLKDYLKDRLSPVHCTIEGKNIEIFDKIRFNEALRLFIKSYKQNGISVGPQSKQHSVKHGSFDYALVQSNKMTEEDFFKYKSKYINYLISIQSKKHKIIPCVESLSHTTGDTFEYAFIFSSRCKNGDILIVHENINPARSTILFVVKKNSYDDSIRSIYNFLHSTEINKRSNIREKNLRINNPNIVKYSSIDHNFFNEWKAYLLYYRGYRAAIYY